jgi:UMF1 family MFS transporter
MAIVIGLFSFAYIEEFTGSMRNSAISLAGFFIIGLLILVSIFFIKTESSTSLAKD